METDFTGVTQRGETENQEDMVPKVPPSAESAAHNLLKTWFKIVAAEVTRLKYYRKYGVLGREVSLFRLAGSAATAENDFPNTL